MDDSTAKARLTRLESLVGEIRDAAGLGLDEDGQPTVFDEVALADRVGRVRAAADRVEEVAAERSVRVRHDERVLGLVEGDGVWVSLVVGASSDGWVRERVPVSVVGVNRVGRARPRVVVRVPLPAVVPEATVQADQVWFSS